MIFQILISILLGLIPEVLFFTLFITYTKGIKEKRVKLFLLISIAYILCMFIQRYKIFYYMLFVILIYWIMKFLYKKKTQIIDVFIINLASIYLTFLVILLYPLINDNYYHYFVLYFLNRILLFIPFIFRKYFNKFYKKYYGLWNRNDNEKRPIKSITLRNISLVVMNISIFILNIVIINIS